MHPCLSSTRELGVEQVGEEGQRVEGPGGVRVAPTHGVVAVVSREPVLVVRLVQPGISGHPVHWHDRQGVLGSDLTIRGGKHVVDPAEDYLVQIQFNAGDHPRCNHCPDLVEVEGHTPCDFIHPVNDQVREVLLPSVWRREMPIEQHQDQRPAGEQMHGTDQVGCHPFEVGIGLTSHVCHEGLVHPAAVKVTPPLVAIGETGIEVHIELTFQLVVVAQPLRARLQGVLRLPAQLYGQGRLPLQQAAEFCLRGVPS
mmetsp:Transcript_78021/g.176344  ORF Transcript_78021/g.176344 Transcript_78021/m.176344 type:complete len:255 (+) Transcript_78021:501-1265(+)